MQIRGAFLPVINGFAVCALIQPHAAIAQSPAEINMQAYATTVRIEGPSEGSGVMYSREGSTYYVLTAKHVFDEEGNYEVVTPDRQRYPINPSRIQEYENIDIAEFAFDSAVEYSVAEIGDSNRILLGNAVFISGWAEETPAVQERAFLFSQGEVSALLQNPDQGYSLLYSNIITINYAYLNQKINKRIKTYLYSLDITKKF